MAVRKRLRSDDPFFANGERVSLGDSQTIAIFCMEENQNNLDDIAVDDLNQDEEYHDQENNCSETLQEYDRHYFENHSFKCSVCNTFFPNDYILDLHIQETHDSYFQSAVQKQKANYACLLTTCRCSFRTESERALHLQTTHGYPKWFRFHSRCGKGKERGEGTMRSSDRSKMRQWYMKRVYCSLPSQLSSVEISDEKGDGLEDSEDVMKRQCNSIVEDERVKSSSRGDHEQSVMTEISVSKKANKKERKKKINATIPCKYYNRSGGCWRGDRCMFLHSKTLLIENAKRGSVILNPSTSRTEDMAPNFCQPVDDKMDIDMINSLTDQIRTKVQISVPAKVSFGRRRAR